MVTPGIPCSREPFRLRGAAISLWATVLLAWAVPGLAGAAGPFRGQVVDDATGLPVEGVVVVAVWEQVRPGIIHHARSFHDVREGVTDTEGRFVLDPVVTQVPDPLTIIEGPKFIVTFKGGYRSMGFYAAWMAREGIRTTDSSGLSRAQYIDEALAHAIRGGVVFAIRPIPFQERRNHLPLRPADAPDDRIPKLQQAIREERAKLGLAP